MYVSSSLSPRSIEANRAVLGRFQRGQCVDSLVIALTVAEKYRQRARVHLGYMQQVILVAHFGEPGLLLFDRHARHVVGVFTMQTHQVALCCLREWGFGKEDPSTACGPARALRGLHRNVLYRRTLPSRSLYFVSSSWLMNSG